MNDNGYSGLSFNALNNNKQEVYVKGEVNSNSNGPFGIQAYVGVGSTLNIIVEDAATLNSNSNSVGFSASVLLNAALNIDVQNKGAFNLCKNTNDDIQGDVNTGASGVTFSANGFTCNQAKVVGFGKDDTPICQDCS